MENIVVSIICNTYNHEKYIRQALDSFIMQKTTFAFEVLVHDDASTDSTAAIIREYEEKYPELIKPIYQAVNQYSQKVSILKSFQYGRVRGKYVALCEGDDYWTDEHKLQKQVDALEAYPDIDICAHRATKLKDGVPSGFFPIQKTDTIFTTEEVILGGGGFVPTASLVFRRTLLERLMTISNLDYNIQMYGSLRGGMLYLADDMAMYRVAVAGSWTRRTYGDDQKQIEHFENVQRILLDFDEQTQHRYAQIIQQKVQREQIAILMIQEQYRQALSEQYREGYRLMSFKQKVKLQLLGRFSWLEKLKRR